MRSLAWMTAACFFAACDVDSGFSDGGNEIADLTNGALTLSTDRVILDGLDLQFTKSSQFTVSSVGEDNLTIYDAKLVANPDAVFTFESRIQSDIVTGESQDWQVAATLQEAGMVEGVIRIQSNDPTTPQLLVTLCAVSKDFAESCPAVAGGEDAGDTADTGDTAD